MRASASGVRTVLDRRGLPALAQAALQRWLGEAAVLPTALLPSSVLWWEPVDAHRARAWCADSGVTASLVFEFGARGEIVRCRGDRHRDTSDGPILTPWEGHFDCYGEANGMQIPRWSEAAWLGAPAAMPYWRARVRTTDYDFG